MAASAYFYFTNFFLKVEVDFTALAKYIVGLQVSSIS